MTEPTDGADGVRIGRRTFLVGGAATWLAACAGDNAGAPTATTLDDAPADEPEGTTPAPEPTVPSTVAPTDSVVDDAFDVSDFAVPWTDLDSEAMQGLGATVLAADPGAVEHARAALGSAPGTSDRERLNAAFQADVAGGSILRVAEWSMPRTMGGVAAALFARSTR